MSTVFIFYMYINIKLLPCVVEVTASVVVVVVTGAVDVAAPAVVVVSGAVEVTAADVVVVTGAVDVKDSAVVAVAASDVMSVAVGVEASVVWVVEDCTVKLLWI